MKKIIIIGLIYFFCNSTFADISPLNSKLQAVVDHDRDKYHLTSLSVSIKLPEESAPRNFVSGYYAQNQKQKITPDTLFQIGSITKTFTATIILKLVEEKKLHLNDKIGRYIPQYPKWKNITISQLLYHTSGTFEYMHSNGFWENLSNNPDQYHSLDDLASLAYLYPVNFKPGTKNNYSNTDYILLGLIIEKVTYTSIQTTFNHYLQVHNLKNTFFTPRGYPDNTKNRIAHGYCYEDDTFGHHQDVTFVGMSDGQTAGAMISTPHDLIDWLEQFFSGKIVSKHSLAQMMTMVSPKNAKPLTKNICPPIAKMPLVEVGYGLGMGLVYFPKYGFSWVHAGGTPGYESFFSYNPCKNIYAVVMYGQKPKKQLIFAQIESDLFKVIDEASVVQSQVEQYQKTHTLPDYCVCSGI